ncbi:MAG: hypothetical protein GY827_12030 [Cytophagales bacterium]|nr:hypothetical protein [Cytophagales bacterium]
MTHIIRIPKLGTFISKVTLVTWKKTDGDLVRRGEIICVVESKKSTFELEAEASGILRILAQKGQVCGLSETIGKIEESEPLPVQEGVLQVKLPALGNGIKKAKIIKWYISTGTSVKKDRPICELQTDKATFELTAEQTGKINYWVYEGNYVYVNDLLYELELV